MLTIESRMVSIFSAHCPISFEHVFLTSTLDPHLTTYHSNIGVHIIVLLELGTSTLMQ